MRVPNGRALAFGLLAGVLLSAIRAPLGLDWTQLQAVDGETAALFRAGALIAIALFLDPRRRAFRGRTGNTAWLLAAATAGYAGHAFLIVASWQPESRLGFASLLVAGTVGLYLLAGKPRDTPDDGDAHLPLLERLGLAVAAAGATISLETLAHHVRFFGLGLPEDDAVIATVFLGVLTVGAVAFGGLLTRPSWERMAPALVTAAAAPATLLGLSFLSRMGPDALFRYLDRFGLDLSRIGTWQATALLAAAAFVAAGFVAGTALATARHPGRLGALILGAAVGLVLRPQVIASIAAPIATTDLARATWAWGIVVLGTGMAVVGALLVAVRERGAQRWITGLLAIVVLIAPWTGPRLVIWSFSPWARAAIVPDLVMPTRSGLVTVEDTRGEHRIVTVDRRRMTPTAEEETVDAMRLAYACTLLAPELRTSGAARVLLIGQATPSRLQALRTLGVTQVDRTAPWFEALDEVEGVLFSGVSLPAGELVPPGEARRRIRSGAYDLVLATPAHGPVLPFKSASELPWGTTEAPVLAGTDVPENTLAVIWLDAASPLTRRSLGERVLVALDRFHFPSIGVVRGDPAPADGRPLLLLAGPAGSRQGVLELLGTIARHRSFALRRLLFDRLEEAATGGAQAELARGLGIHFRSQQPSSPYETPAQRIELEEDELRAFYAAAGAVQVLDAFSRDLWEGIAWLLTEKRRPDLALVYLESVAQRHGPWPTLERAVAHAYRELLDPEEARAVYRRLLEFAPDDLEALVASAELSSELGDHAEALRDLRSAVELAPQSYAIRRALALALVASGDPAAQEALRQLLAEHPADEELLEHLEEGPSLPRDGKGSGETGADS